MTLAGRLFRLIGNYTRWSPYTRYEAFYSSYSGSDAQSQYHWYQTLFWIGGTILSQVIADFFEAPITVPLPFVGNFLSFDILIIAAFGFFGILIATVLGPLKYYFNERPFKFDPTWYPITTKPELLREGHEDKLRLSGDSVRIAVHFDIAGKVEGYNLRAVPSDSSIGVSLFAEVGMSQQPYSDGRGVHSTNSVENDTILNIYEVVNEIPLAGDPGHGIRFYDVPEEVSNSYAEEVSEQEAKKHGRMVLDITVTG